MMVIIMIIIDDNDYDKDKNYVNNIDEEPLVPLLGDMMKPSLAQPAVLSWCMPKLCPTFVTLMMTMMLMMMMLKMMVIMMKPHEP